MIAAVWDFHIAGPWADWDRQHLVLDMIGVHDPEAVIFCGDTFEQMSGLRAMRRSDVFQRTRDMARRRAVRVMRGNVYHDDELWLAEIADEIAPIEVYPDPYMDIVTHDHGTFRLTHGSEYDSRVRIWQRFRWAARHLPWLSRHILPRLPSDLFGMGRSREATRIIQQIHDRAHEDAKRAGVTMLTGHTHFAELRWGSGSDTDIWPLVAMGSAGCNQGPAFMALLDPHDGLDLLEIPQTGEIGPLSDVSDRDASRHGQGACDKNAMALQRRKNDFNDLPTTHGVLHT